MSDPTLNYYLGSGLEADRASYTPSPATPAAGPDPSYVYITTDTQLVWGWTTATGWFVAGSTAGSVPVEFEAGEALSANDAVNIYDDAGDFKARIADATDTAKYADGFVLAAVLSGATALVYFSGVCGGQTALVPGPVWLSDTVPGEVTQTPPPADVLQQLGVSTSATEYEFIRSVPINQ